MQERIGFGIVLADESKTFVPEHDLNMTTATIGRLPVGQIKSRL
jgi:hypothetical protein